MTTTFDRWEKDPFFAAAEEVQESADRMESTYRTWIHAKRDPSSVWDCEQLHRDLHTALGTTKWQLDEFQRAVRSSYEERMGDETQNRHREFIVAIEEQVVKIEKSMKDTAYSEGKGTPRWVRLNEDEREELALFLTGPSESEENINETSEGINKDPIGNRFKNSSNQIRSDNHEGKPRGHRRTASATVESGAWNISISDEILLQNSSGESTIRAPRKVPSFSGFLNYMEPTKANVNWSKHCVRKWKAADRQQESDTALLPIQQANRQGMNGSYERNKGCMECEEWCDEKQLLNGWYGALHRRLQRSLYQMQFRKPLHLSLCLLLLLSLLVLVSLRTM